MCKWARSRKTLGHGVLTDLKLRFGTAKVRESARHNGTAAPGAIEKMRRRRRRAEAEAAGWVALFCSGSFRAAEGRGGGKGKAEGAKLGTNKYTQIARRFEWECASKCYDERNAMDWMASWRFA